LAGALEADEKLMAKREKRGDKLAPSLNKSDESSEEEQMSLEDIGKEYIVFEKEMEDKYHPDNVLLIRDWFRRYLVYYAEGYKDLLAKKWKDDGYYDNIEEWEDDGNPDLFPTDLDIDIDYAKQALYDMKEIERNWINYLDEHNNMAPGPDNAEQIIPSRLFS
jgi:hypothetical protein